VPDLHIKGFVEAEDPFEIVLVVDPRAATSPKNESDEKQDHGDCEDLSSSLQKQPLKSCAANIRNSIIPCIVSPYTSRTRINSSDSQYNCSTWNNLEAWNNCNATQAFAWTAKLFHVEQFRRAEPFSFVPPELTAPDPQVW
jgi:hypothetical protein